MPNRRIILLLVGVTASLLLCGQAIANDAVQFGWTDEGVAVSVKDQPANAVLEVISAATGIPMVLDPSNSARLNGLYRKHSLEDLLLDLSPGMVIQYRYDERLRTHVIDRVYSTAKVAEEIKEAQLRDLVITREKLNDGFEPPPNRTIRYSGIGASIMSSSNGDGIFLKPLSPAAPSAKSGIKLGDLVIAIDGRLIADFPGTAEMAAAIRGPENTEVTLTIRYPDGRTLERRVRREVFTWVPPGQITH